MSFSQFLPIPYDTKINIEILQKMLSRLWSIGSISKSAYAFVIYSMFVLQSKENNN